MSKLDDSLSKLNKQLESIGALDFTDALLASGYTLQAEAQRRAPVDTGFLRDSAQTEIVGDGVEVSFNTDYAAYQEFKFNPYVRPAIDEESEKIIQAARNQIEKQIKGAV